MKKIESGRSMVEMLGVLAIIGVLSIGGIAGYKMAINRYRANEIVDAVSKVITIAHAQTQKSRLTGLNDIGIDGMNRPVGGCATSIMAYTYTPIDVEVSIVDIRGCAKKTDIKKAFYSILGENRVINGYRIIFDDIPHSGGGGN